MTRRLIQQELAGRTRTAFVREAGRLNARAAAAARAQHERHRSMLAAAYRPERLNRQV